MPAKPNQKKPEPYLWDILPVSPPDPAIVEELDPWNVLEFLRIEALLRSPQIMELYEENLDFFEELDKCRETSKQGTITIPPTLLLKDKLFTDYRVNGGWQVLAGFHHRLLKPSLMVLHFKNQVDSGEHAELQAAIEMFNANSGLLNLEPLYKKGKGFSACGVDEPKNLDQAILDKDPRYLWVRIDTAYPPTRIWKELKKELKKRHKTITVSAAEFGNFVLFTKSSAWGVFQPHHPNQKPPRLGLKTWFEYFKCYDLHQAKGKSFAAIAIQIFDDSNKNNFVKKGYNRVGKLIHCAETKNWPPPEDLLNPK